MYSSVLLFIWSSMVEMFLFKNFVNLWFDIFLDVKVNLLCLVLFLLLMCFWIWMLYGGFVMIKFVCCLVKNLEIVFVLWVFLYRIWCLLSCYMFLGLEINIEVCLGNVFFLVWDGVGVLWLDNRMLILLVVKLVIFRLMFIVGNKLVRLLSLIERSLLF